MSASNPYAQIQSGVIINTVLALPGDFFDPAFCWVSIANLNPQPQVGWTYDGTSFTPPDLPTAVGINLGAFQTALAAFISNRYPDQVRLNLIGIYINADLTGLSNRKAYVAQLFPWQNAVITYAATYIATVNALPSAAAVHAYTWDFSSLASSDPGITALAALQILT